MNKISKIALLVIIAVSVGLMGWAVVVGMDAPESKKVAATMSISGQYDKETGDPIKDTLGKIVPVTSVKDGIEAMYSATIYQMRNAEGLNYINTVSEIKEIDATIDGYKADYDRLGERIKEIDSIKTNDAASYKKNKKALDAEYEAANKFIEEYGKNGYAELYAKEADWAERMSEVSGAKFDEESKLVIEYLEEKKAGYEKSLESLEADMKAKKGSYDAQLAIFKKAYEFAGVKLQQKPTNPEDEESVKMDDYKTTVEQYKEAVKTLEADKKLSKEKKAELKTIKGECTDAVITDVLAYDALASSIVSTKLNIETITTNIDTINTAIEAAKAEGEHLMALAQAVNANLFWLYFLMVFAVVFVIFGFILNIIQNPNWIKIGAVVAVVAAVFGLAYAIGVGHGWLDGEILYMLDANGNTTDIAFGLGSLDSADRVVFSGSDYMLADVSIWVTYIAFVLAGVSAVFSWIWGIFKS
jgi:t-SNARE complex subunit (syntaxin)